MRLMPTYCLKNNIFCDPVPVLSCAIRIALHGIIPVELIVYNTIRARQMICMITRWYPGSRVIIAPTPARTVKGAPSELWW
jgi:hypothetical protein